MWQEVLKVIKPFLDFLKTFDSNQAHQYVGFNVESMFQIFKGCEKFCWVWKSNSLHY
jgi:hypothetical protein